MREQPDKYIEIIGTPNNQVSLYPQYSNQPASIVQKIWLSFTFQESVHWPQIPHFIHRFNYRYFQLVLTSKS